MGIPEIVLARRPTLAGVVVYGLALFVLAAIAWSYLTKVDVVVRARGVVRPEGEVIRLIAETGGKIQEVRAREGAQVRQGDPLVYLDSREVSLRKKALEQRIYFVEFRLLAFDRGLRDAAAIYVAEDRKSQLEIAAAQVEQTRKEEAFARRQLEHEATTSATRANLEHSRSRYLRGEELFQEGLISRQVFDEIRTAVAEANADHARASSNRPDIADLVLHEAMIAQLVQSRELKWAEFQARRHQLESEAAPLQAQLAELYQQLEQSKLDLARTTISSPVDGQISSLAPLHSGEVVSAGSAIATISATSSPLVVESWLPTPEAPFVRSGQRVRLQTDAFPPGHYGSIDGTVLSISPDARFTDSLSGAYRVLISPAEGSPLLRLGMTFDVRFITREERILRLFVQKIRKELPNV